MLAGLDQTAGTKDDHRTLREYKAGPSRIWLRFNAGGSAQLKGLSQAYPQGFRNDVVATARTGEASPLKQIAADLRISESLLANGGLGGERVGRA
jgi:hypothetical protein